MGLLAAKVAFITGAASGLGSAMARRFAGEGARVVIADIQREAGEAMRAEIVDSGGQALYLHCDVSQAASVRDALEATVEHFGTLDIAVANAGINGVFAPIEELQPENGPERWMSISPALISPPISPCPTSKKRAAAAFSSPAASMATGLSLMPAPQRIAPPRPGRSLS